MHAYRVTVAEDDEDLATALLWEAGTVGIEVGAASEECVSLLAYFEDDVALDLLPERLADVRIEPVPVSDVDWVARFRESFRAFRVGGFVIAPPWDRPLDDEGLLVVDPGRAFGTGTHETTRLCLGALDDRRVPQALVAKLVEPPAHRLGQPAAHPADEAQHAVLAANP